MLAYGVPKLSRLWTFTYFDTLFLRTLLQLPPLCVSQYPCVSRFHSQDFLVPSFWRSPM